MPCPFLGPCCVVLRVPAPAEQPRQLLRVFLQQLTELVEPALEPRRGAGDPDGGDHVLVRPEDRGGDTGEPDLELVPRGGVSAGAHLGQVDLEVVPAAQGVPGRRLEPVARPRHHVPGEEDLAERRAVRWDLDLGPVARAEQEGRVDLRNVVDPGAVGDSEVHVLASAGPDPLEHRLRQAGQLGTAVVAGGVEHEQRPADVLPRRAALDQAVVLQRRQQPGRGRAGQSGGLGHLGEGHGVVGLHDVGEQAGSAVDRLGPALRPLGLDDRTAAHS